MNSYLMPNAFLHVSLRCLLPHPHETSCAKCTRHFAAQHNNLHPLITEFTPGPRQGDSVLQRCHSASHTRVHEAEGGTAQDGVKSPCLRGVQADAAALQVDHPVYCPEPPILHELRAEAKKAGLYNFFLTEASRCPACSMMHNYRFNRSGALISLPERDTRPDSN